MYYLNYFFIFSILGHIIESFFYASGESGILFLPWTPVYGIGVIFILLIDKLISKYKLKGFLKLILLFFASSIILSMVEAVGGYLIKGVLNKELWNYTNLKFNMGPYTALEMSLIWGIASLILIYLLKPLIDKIISKIPKYLTYLLTIIFISDLILTFFKH